MAFDSYSLDLGSEPFDEPCLCPVDPNDPHYLSNQRVVCQAYILGLERKYGTPPKGARFKITTNSHDFGTYLSVSCDYRFYDLDDENNDASINPEDYAYKCGTGFARWSEVDLNVQLVAGRIIVTDLRAQPDPCLDHTTPPCGAD